MFASCCCELQAAWLCSCLAAAKPGPNEQLAVRGSLLPSHVHVKGFSLLGCLCSSVAVSIAVLFCMGSRASCLGLPGTLTQQRCMPELPGHVPRKSIAKLWSVHVVLEQVHLEKKSKSNFSTVLRPWERLLPRTLQRYPRICQIPPSVPKHPTHSLLLLTGYNFAVCFYMIACIGWGQVLDDCSHQWGTAGDSLLQGDAPALLFRLQAGAMLDDFSSH